MAQVAVVVLMMLITGGACKLLGALGTGNGGSVLEVVSWVELQLASGALVRQVLLVGKGACARGVPKV
jgi:hypothetical protein